MHRSVFPESAFGGSLVGDCLGAGFITFVLSATWAQNHNGFRKYGPIPGAPEFARAIRYGDATICRRRSPIGTREGTPHTADQKGAWSYPECSSDMTIPRRRTSQMTGKLVFRWCDQSSRSQIVPLAQRAQTFSKSGVNERPCCRRLCQAAFFCLGGDGNATVIQTVSSRHFGHLGNIAFFLKSVSTRQQSDAYRPFRVTSLPVFMISFHRIRCSCSALHFLFKPDDQYFYFPLTPGFRKPGGVLKEVASRVPQRWQTDLFLKTNENHERFLKWHITATPQQGKFNKRTGETECAGHRQITPFPPTGAEAVN
jgi:hypothetical protein